MDKKSARLRRAMRGRSKMKELGVPRIVVHRTPRHVYAQIVLADQGKVLTSASSVERQIRASRSDVKAIELANAIGKLVAERAIALGVKAVVFDRSGFKYHGRIKAIAEGARSGGLEF